jgi:hypothetical protein
MGISLESKKRLNAVRIISKQDDAIDFDNSDWEKYDEDPIENESALKFLAEKHPTVFICNFEFDAKENSKIQDAMFSGIDEERNPKPAYGAWSLAVVKYSLKGIENHPSNANPIKFKVDSKSYVSEETLNILQKVGVIGEIFNHYLKLSQTGVNKNLKN